MEPSQSPKLAPPKRSIRFRRSISSLMDHARSPSSSPLQPSRSPSPTRSLAPVSATASAIANSTNILFVPTAGTRPRAKSAQSCYRDLNQPHPAVRARAASHSRDSSPQRGPDETLPMFTGAIPQPMSYEMPPTRPLPGSKILSCYPSSSSLSTRYRQGLPAEINKKPLPPLPPAVRSISPQRPSRSATPVQQASAPVPSITIEETGPRPYTPSSSGRQSPVELPVPGQLLNTPSTVAPVELESPEPEYHVHATSRPDCAVCAQQDQFWGFGLGIGLDFPLTPPDTPESPPAEIESERAKVRFSMLKRMPQEGRDITSWLALSPPMSSTSSGFEVAFYTDDDGEPSSAIEDYDYRASSFQLEQAKQLNFTMARAALAGTRGQQRPRTPKTLLTLPSTVLASIFKSFDNHTDVYSLAATHSHFYDLLTMHKLDILVSTTPQPLAIILAGSSASVPSIPSGQSIYDSASLYTAALRHYFSICDRVKTLIREHCQNFLSKRLLDPPTPAEDYAFTVALYNLWAFSLDFPTCRRNSAWEADVAAQAQWLRRQNLTQQQLKDILEVYECIGVLLCPLTEDLRAAVQADVIEVQPVRADMETDLELWVLQLQTLEIGRIVTVLDMAGDFFSGEERWTEVKKCGLALVRVGANRRMWLKCAVGEVVKELQQLERRSKIARKQVWGLTNSVMSGIQEYPRQYPREPSRLFVSQVV